MPTVQEILLKINAETGELEASLKGAESAVEKFTEKTEKSLFSATKTAKILGGAIASIATYQVAKGIIGAGLQMERLDARMLGAVGSADAAKNSMEFLRAESERLGISFVEAADGFSGFAASALRSGLNLGEVKEVFTATAEAAAVFQLSAEDSGLVFKALEQIAAKGVVSMEEFRQQLGERLPVAMDAASKGMGVTQQKLIEMIESGKLAATDFLPAFARGMKETLGDSVATATQTATANINRMNNALFELKVASASGEAMNVLNETVEEFTRIISDESMQDGLGAFADGLSTIAKGALWTASAIGQLGKTGGILIGAGIAKIRGDDEEAIIEAARELGYYKGEAMAQGEIDGRASVQAAGGGDFDSLTLSDSGDGASVLGIDPEKIEEELETLRESFLTREEIELEHHENRLAQISAMLDDEVTLNAEQKAKLELLSALHAEKIKKIQEKTEKEKLADKEKSFRQLVSMTSNNNKALFEINKAFALADAVLGAKKAILDAFVWGNSWGGPAAGAAAAAVAGVATATHISAIASSDFGGSRVNSSSSGVGAGSIGVRAVDEFGLPTQEQFGGEQKKAVFKITGTEAEFSKDIIRKIAEGLNEFTKEDGGRLNATFVVNGEEIA